METGNRTEANLEDFGQDSERTETSDSDWKSGTGVRIVAILTPSQCCFRFWKLNSITSLNVTGFPSRPLYAISGFTFPAHAPSTWQPNALPLPPPPQVAPSLSDDQIQGLVRDLTALSLRRMDQGVTGGRGGLTQGVI